MTESIAIKTYQEIMGTYQPVVGAPKFNGLADLAYWGSQNIIDVDECVRIRNNRKGDWDNAGKRARVSHQRRGLAYWRAMIYFHNSHLGLFSRLKENEYDPERKIEVYERLKRAENKVNALEKRFPGAGKVFIEEIDLENFKGIVELYSPGSKNKDPDQTLAEIRALAYHDAQNVIAVSNAMNISRKAKTNKDMEMVFKKSLHSHQDRALDFWGTIHYFYIEQHTHAKRNEASSEERGRIWGMVQETHRKMSKLENRHLGYSNSHVDLDRQDIEDNHS